MGDLTRLQMVTEICDIVGKSTAGASVSGAALNSRVINYLGFAQRRLSKAYNFDELNAIQDSAATVTDIKRYPLSSGTNNLGLTRPKDIHSITIIDGASSRTLKRWSPRAFRKRFPYPENFTTDRPSIYTLWGNNLDIFKIPNAVYTLSIWYPQWPTPLTSDSQTSDFTDKDELLITLGVMETYLALEEYNDAAIWATRAKGQLIDTINDSGEMDWEPTAEPFGFNNNTLSGTPWLDPAGSYGDPLYGGAYE